MPFANQDWPATAGAVLLLAALFGLNNDSPFGTPSGPAVQPHRSAHLAHSLMCKAPAFFPLRLFDWHSPCVIRPERTRCSELIRNALFASRRAVFRQQQARLRQQQDGRCPAACKQRPQLGQCGRQERGARLDSTGDELPARRSVRNARQRTPHRA